MAGGLEVLGLRILLLRLGLGFGFRRLGSPLNATGCSDSAPLDGVSFHVFRQLDDLVNGIFDGVGGRICYRPRKVRLIDKVLDLDLRSLAIRLQPRRAWPRAHFLDFLRDKTFAIILVFGLPTNRGAIRRNQTKQT